MASPAAGWYPDPAGSGNARYWDGQRWTDQVRARARSVSRTSTGTELSLDQLLTPLLHQLGQHSRAPANRRGRSDQARVSTRHDHVTTRSTLVSHDTSVTHSPRVSADAPRRWGGLGWWLLIGSILLVGLVLLAAMMVAGPDADLGETLGSMLG